MAQGWVESRSNAGFFVKRRAGTSMLPGEAPSADLCFDASGYLRQIFESRNVEFEPGCGWLPNDWLYDIYADLDPEPQSSLASLDQMRRVAYVGSYSKTDLLPVGRSRSRLVESVFQARNGHEEEQIYRRADRRLLEAG